MIRPQIQQQVDLRKKRKALDDQNNASTEPQITAATMRPLVLATEKLMAELDVIMKEEILLLGKQDMTKLVALTARKNKLVADCQSNLKCFAARPDLLKAVPEEDRARLKRTGEKLALTRERNSSVLRGAIEGTRTLMLTVINMAQKHMREHQGYKDPRTVQNALGPYSPVCPPMAFNKTA